MYTLYLLSASLDLHFKNTLYRTFFFLQAFSKPGIKQGLWFDIQFVFVSFRLMMMMMMMINVLRPLLCTLISSESNDLFIIWVMGIMMSDKVYCFNSVGSSLCPLFSFNWSAVFNDIEWINRFYQYTIGYICKPRIFLLVVIPIL